MRHKQHYTAGGGPRVKTSKRRWWIAAFVVLVGGATAAGVYLYWRPLPDPRIVVSLNTPEQSKKPQLAWPDVGTSAVSAVGYDFVASKDDINEKIPTASMIKLLTVLCVLEKYPLKDGEQGPTLTMTAEDVARYEEQAANQGNHIRIVEGEQMSLYHTLEAVLIQSSNSTADTLAVWAFGSLEAYAAYAANYLATNGLKDTRTGNNAAGRELTDSSTLSDLIKLGKLARQNQIIMKILGTPSATFQTHGTIYNRNRQGNDILLGGKTGSIDDIKGSYLFMATTKNTVPGTDVPIVGVIAYDSSVQEAIRDSEALAESAAPCFETVTVAKTGAVVGTMDAAWGESTPLITTSDLVISRWCDSAILLTTQTDGIARGEDGVVSATVDGHTVSVPITSQTKLAAPTYWWRLTHPR